MIFFFVTVVVDIDTVRDTKWLWFTRLLVRSRRISMGKDLYTWFCYQRFSLGPKLSLTKIWLTLQGRFGLYLRRLLSPGGILNSDGPSPYTAEKIKSI